jgi:hypothetical protein
MAELMRRYVVMTMATEAPFDPLDPEGVFVLKPWKDPAALRALAAYCENCYPELARDLEAWMRAIEAGPSIRGDVGRRNEAHVKVVAAAVPPEPAARARTAARRAVPPKRRKAAPTVTRAKRAARPAPKAASRRRAAAKPKKRRR